QPILDLLSVANPALLIQNQGRPEDVLVFGVPLVIGAKKGLPNFNEFQFETKFMLTRKLQLVKNQFGRIEKTNQFFTMYLTMPSAAEFWNSYQADYGVPVDIYITNYVSMLLTNDCEVVWPTNLITGDRLSIPANGWRGFKSGTGQSFI